MTLDEFVVEIGDREDPREMRQFTAGIRATAASDPDFILATTFEGWIGELEAWRTIMAIMGPRIDGPVLSLDQFVDSLRDLEHQTELEAFAAATREDARHDPARWPLERRTQDWRREFEGWRCTQKLIRAGALRELTIEQLRKLGLEPKGDGR